jgi:hypothetical protein
MGEMKRLQPSFPASRRGSILVFSLIGSLVLFALVAPLLLRLSGHYRVTEKNFRTLAALNLAEAGVERTIWELNKGVVADWTGDILVRRLALSGIQTDDGAAVGEVDIVIFHPASDNPVVEATGRVPWAEGLPVSRTLRVVLRRGFRSHFDFGIFGDEGVDLHGNAYTDSYNSVYGPYDPLAPGDLGDLGTNAGGPQDVYLVNNTTINGNCLSGFESQPNVVIVTENNAEITGTRTALEEPKPLPVYPPPLLADRGSYDLAPNREDGLITESGKYSSFSLGPNSKVTVSGQVTLFVDGDFTMNSNSVLEIAPGSEVEIILGSGAFIQRSNTQINNLSRDPRALAILGTEDFHSMTFRSNSDFFGVVYVPEATIDFYANADFFGSIVANYLHLSSNAGIHYDESLGEWEKYGVQLTTYVVKSWQEKL